MDPVLQTALERFLELYKAKAPRPDLIRASQWIIERFSPFKHGDEIQVPVSPPTKDSGLFFEITSVSILVERRTLALYWCFAGKGMGVRQSITGPFLTIVKSPTKRGNPRREAPADLKQGKLI